MLSLLISCNNSQSQEVVELSDYQTENTLKFSDTLVDVCFEDFIYQFWYDKEFQQMRSKIKGVDVSKLYNFYDYANYFYGSFKEKEEYSKDLTNEKYLSIFKPTENKKTTLSFEKIDGRWFLVKIQDFEFDFGNIENFEAFLYQFSTDSIFQKEHIKFPLKYVYADWEDDYEDKTDYLTEENVFQSNFFENDNLAFFHNNDISNKKQIKIHYRGIDNGILGYFYFEKFNNAWRLIESNDYSM